MFPVKVMNRYVCGVVTEPFMWEECTDWHEHTYSICEGNPCCPKIHIYWEPILPWVIIQLGFSQKLRWGTL